MSATAEQVAAALNAHRTPSGWQARCPAHEDRRASLSIGEGEDGRLLLHCHAGCAFDDIMTAAGIERAKPNGHDQGQQKARIVATYCYHDAAGKLVYQVVREEPKAFLQRRPNGGDDWIWNLKGVERVPYRLPALLKASEAIVCEGEKDCDNLARLGFAATTNPGSGEGGRKWPASFAQWFVGRHVRILPDNDAPGHKHAAAVAGKLADAAASIKVVALPGLPPKGDVSDWLAAGGDVDQLRALIEAAPYWEPSEEPDEQEAADGLTEDELTLEFTARHRHELRYVAAWGAWQRWRGSSWHREDTLAAFDMARAVCRNAAASVDNAKLRAKIMAGSTRAAVENMARADRAHAATTDQWDSDLFTVGTPSRAA
jgi:putative DNA primase/helicase